MLDVCLCFFISLYSEFSGDAALQHVRIPWCFFTVREEKMEKVRNIYRIASCLFLPAACKGKHRP